MKKHLLLIIFLLFTLVAFGQNKIYLNEKFEKINDKSIATYFREIVVNADSTVSFKDYFVSDSSLKVEGRFKDTSQKIFDGYFKIYDHGIINSSGLIENNGFEGKWRFYYIHENLVVEKIYFDGNETGVVFNFDSKGNKLFSGKIINEKREDYCIDYNPSTNNKWKEGAYLHGVENGSFYFYYNTGELLWNGEFKNGKKIGNWRRLGKDGKIICETLFYNDSASSVSDTCFNSKTVFGVVQMPCYLGGTNAMANFMNQNLKYPQKAKDNQTEGKVILKFVVEEDGTVSNLKILREIGDGCGNAALEVIKKMPKWIPGRLSGIPVKSDCTLPVVFTLQ